MADFSGRQDSIQKVCRDIDKDWPDCKMVFSTYLLEPDYGPLVGKTNCDNSCIFTSGVACASKVAMCVNPCTSNPASSQCIQCVSNIGSCCSCLAYAVGKVAGSSGQEICDQCPAALIHEQDIKNPPQFIKKGCDTTINPDCSFLTANLYQDQSKRSAGLQPLLGSTNYEWKCIFDTALICTDKAGLCVQKCVSNPVSDFCLVYEKSTGSDSYSCTTYAIGRPSSSAGKIICSFCPPDSSEVTGAESSTSILHGGITVHNPAPAVRGLVYTMEESSATLPPDSLNFIPNFLQLASNCSWYDIPCHLSKPKCDFCKQVIPQLIKMKTQKRCNVGCIAAVEVVAGGPEDPVGDMVAAACPALCAYVFLEGGTEAAPVICKRACLC